MSLLKYSLFLFSFSIAIVSCTLEDEKKAKQAAKDNASIEVTVKGGKGKKVTVELKKKQSDNGTKVTVEVRRKRSDNGTKVTVEVRRKRSDNGTKVTVKKKKQSDNGTVASNLALPIPQLFVNARVSVFMWTPVLEATNYQLFQDNVSNGSFSRLFKKYESQNFVSYEKGLKDLSVGTHYFKMKACNAYNCSAFSNVVSVVISPKPKLTAPQLNFYSSLKVFYWTGSQDSTLRFKLFRDNHSNGQFNQQVNVNGERESSYTEDVSSLPNGTYYYRLKVCRAGQCSDFSNTQNLRHQRTLSQKEISDLYGGYGAISSEMKAHLEHFKVESDGSIYAITKKIMSWDAAHTLAKRLGGNLVSIKDQAENDLVKSLGDAWIGYSDDPNRIPGASEWSHSSNGPSGWRWTDNSQDNYSNWRSSPQEPNNDWNKEHCAYMTSEGGWNDNDCTVSRKATIEFKPKVELKELTIKEPRGYSNSLDFNSKGSRFVSGGFKVTLWNATSGKVLRAWDYADPRSSKSGVESVAFSPDDTQVAAGGHANDIKIWDIASGSLIKTLAHPESSDYYWVTSIDYSPDGKYLVSANQSSKVRIWNLASGQAVKILKHPRYVGVTAWSPDGSKIATASDFQVAVWDAASGRQLKIFNPSSVAWSVAWSPDSKKIVVGAKDKVRIWDVASGALKTLQAAGVVSTVAWSPDRKKMASGETYSNTIRIWDTTSWKLLKTLKHQHHVNAVKFSPDSQWLLSSSADQTIRIWKIAAVKPKPRLSLDKTFSNLAFAASVIKTADKGFAILASAGGSTRKLLKLDQQGNEVWRKDLVDVKYSKSIVQTSDGGFVIAGDTRDGYITVPLVLKLDKNGNQVWKKKSDYDGSASAVIQTTQGGLAIAGYESYAFWSLKLNQDGTKVWSDGYPTFTPFEYANALVQTSDGNLVLAGNANVFYGSSNVYILKLNQSNGKKIWSQTFGGRKVDKANSILQTADGHLMVAGATENKGKGSKDVWLLKLDSSGKKVWDKTFGGSGLDKAESLIQTADGGFVMAAYTTSKGKGRENAWVLRLDRHGKVIWEKVFDNSRIYSVVEVTKGEYAIVGVKAKDQFFVQRNAWFFKLSEK